MNKKEAIDCIKEVVNGHSGLKYLIMRKKEEENYILVDYDADNMLEQENYGYGPENMISSGDIIGSGDMIFLHEDDDCTLREAESLLNYAERKVSKNE